MRNFLLVVSPLARALTASPNSHFSDEISLKRIRGMFQPEKVIIASRGSLKEFYYERLISSVSISIHFIRFPLFVSSNCLCLFDLGLSSGVVWTNLNIEVDKPGAEGIVNKLLTQVFWLSSANLEVRTDLCKPLRPERRWGYFSTDSKVICIKEP